MLIEDVETKELNSKEEMVDHRGAPDGTACQTDIALFILQDAGYPLL